MAEIPNILNQLRTQRSDAPRRGPRRRGPPSSSEDTAAPSKSIKDPDLVVQQTDTDAAGSRLSCVERGYLDDAFASAFSNGVGPARRMPIINRGTYVRTVAIDRVVDEFLQPSGRRQIVSLGAGTDTRPFRLLQRRRVPKDALLYHEFDFADTTRKKIEAIKKSPSTLGLLKPETTENGDSSVSESSSSFTVSDDDACLRSACYTLTPLDLRRLATSTPPKLDHIDASLPTLILSECCLTYFPAESSTSILSYFLRLISPTVAAQVVLYEPIGADDAFGRTMVANLASRDISMPGLEEFKGIREHKARLKSCGFDQQQGWTIREIWDTWVPAQEKMRLRLLEGLDEEEEWVLLASHYALVRGTRQVAAEDA